MGIDVWVLSLLEYSGLRRGIWGQATDRRGWKQVFLWGCPGKVLQSTSAQCAGRMGVNSELLEILFRSAPP